MTWEKAAFTLTEVLLACVIVGVISALILPIFVSKYQARSFNLGFQRMTKTLNNALDNLIITENKGSYFNTIMYVAETPETYEENSGKFLKKYLKLSKYCGDNNRDCFANVYYEYKDKDKNVYNPEFNGACGSLKNGSSICLTPQIGAESPKVLLDINGKKGPNVLGQDLRTFTLNFKTRTAINTQTRNVIVSPPYERGDTEEPPIDPPEPTDSCADGSYSRECCISRQSSITSRTDRCCNFNEIHYSVPACICRGKQDEEDFKTYIGVPNVGCVVAFHNSYSYTDARYACAGENDSEFPNLLTLGYISEAHNEGNIGLENPDIGFVDGTNSYYWSSEWCSGCAGGYDGMYTRRLWLGTGNVSTRKLSTPGLTMCVIPLNKL